MFQRLYISCKMNYQENLYRRISIILVSVFTCYWGVVHDSYFVIYVGLICTFIGIRNDVEKQRAKEQRKKWENEMHGRIIFFYATTQDKQIMIEQVMTSLLPANCIKIAYRGPKLESEIDFKIIKFFLENFVEIIVHKPTIFTLMNGTLFIENLEELQQTDVSRINMQGIHDKINRIKRISVSQHGPY